MNEYMWMQIQFLLRRAISKNLCLTQKPRGSKYKDVLHNNKFVNFRDREHNLMSS